MIQGDIFKVDYREGQLFIIDEITDVNIYSKCGEQFSTCDCEVVQNVPKYIVGSLKIAQITSDSLLHEVEQALKGREAFIDNSDLKEKMFQADVFQAILDEEKISKKAECQLIILNDQTVNFNYIQIIN